MNSKKFLIPLSSPNLRGNENKYLKNCINTNFVSSIGKYVSTFEKKISKFLNVNYAVTCNSGTSALHLALLTLGIKSNHEVIIPTISFIATANVISYLNASPIFMDCDKYYNIDVKKLLSFLKNETYQKQNQCYNKLSKKRISAIIVVHVFGNAVDITPVIKICRKKNIKIIEDAAGALGTKYLKGKIKNRFAGTIGDIGCISFNGNKILTCGGGGALLTNKKIYYKKSLYLSTQAFNNKDDYTHNEIGYNYRLTNLQAAVGLAQLERVNVFLKKNKQIYDFYKQNLKKINFISFDEKPKYAKNNNWLISISLKKKFKNKKNSFLKLLFKEKVQSRSIWRPIHLQKKYKKFQKYKISFANTIFKNTVNLPAGNNIKISEIKKVIKKLKKL